MDADMSMISALNTTVDASRIRTPPPTTSNPPTGPLKLTRPGGTAADEEKTVPKPTNSRQPPVPQPVAKALPPAPKPVAIVEETIKLADVRNQLFNDEPEAEDNTTNKAATGRARARGNITMSFEKKVGGNVKINQAPPVAPKQTPSSMTPIQPASRVQTTSSPEVSSFNASKNDSDKFRTVESSATMRLANYSAGGEDQDQVQNELAQLKGKLARLTAESEDKQIEFESRIKSQQKTTADQATEIKRLQDERRELINYKRDYLLAKDESETLRNALQDKKTSSDATHPDTIRLAQVQASIGQLQASNDKLSMDKDDLKADNAKLVSDISDLKLQLQKQAGQESRRIEGFNLERAAWSEREKTLLDKDRDFQGNLEERNRRIEKLKKEIEEITRDHSEQITGLNIQIENLNKKLVTIDDENSDLKEKLRLLEDDMEEKVQLNAIVQERQKTEKLLNSEKNDLKQQVVAANETIESLRMELRETQQAQSAAESVHAGQIESKDMVISRMQTEINQANDLLNAKETELASVQEKEGSELLRDREKVIYSL